jgi:hypothetical protein
MISLAWTAAWRPWHAGDPDTAQVYGLLSIRLNGLLVLEIDMPPWATGKYPEPSAREMTKAIADFMAASATDFSTILEGAGI